MPQKHGATKQDLKYQASEIPFTIFTVLGRCLSSSV